MRLVTAMLLRNEAASDRYLERVLRRCREFSDTIVCLDDRSSDATPDICREYGAVVKTRETLDAQAWGSEASARKELWDFASEYIAGPNDWLLICDADMVFVGDPRELCLSREVNSWATVLFDVWSETEYREDNFWIGHRTPRIWLVAPQRVPRGWRAEWGTRGIHVGHLPANLPLITGIAPPDRYHWLHMAYKNPAHRAAKVEQYKGQFHLMSPHERAHAESIIQ